MRKMKLIRLGWPLLLSVLALTTVLAGVGEGGGHDYEGRFKKKIETIIEDSLKMSKKARATLKFDLNSLAAITKLEMLVLCADKTQIKTLQDLDKLAYVFAENSREIRLDCSKDRETGKKWEKLLTSEDVYQHIIFIHEALRVQNVLDDDNYVFSGSYIDAYHIDQQELDRYYFRLLHTRNNDCTIHFSTSSTNNTVIFLKKNQRELNSYLVKNLGADQNIEQMLLNNASDSVRRIKRNLVYNARHKGCFD